ncbi:hypothetical protein GCM10009416_20380 [Craurococcus roseus]|uniref:Flp family type IVb pilin n=1 Tax=Craurococcus roseus TaxID=77585 RepID=A0ABP3Q7F5_9PROT
MIDNAKQMINTVKSCVQSAAADRKGATAIEYALIAAAAAAVILVGFRAFFDRIIAFLGGISFV